MLREVLRLAVERGSIGSEELALALDMSPELVRLALAELVRHDYLRVVASADSTACEQCPLRAACLYRHQPRVWQLGRKGRAWADKYVISRASAIPNHPV